MYKVLKSLRLGELVYDFFKKGGEFVVLRLRLHQDFLDWEFLLKCLVKWYTIKRRKTNF